MSSFALSIYVNESSHGKRDYSRYFATNLYYALAWPQSHNPLATTNGHHSPPALVEHIISQPAATSINNPTLDSISISATTDSNHPSELQQIFDFFDCLFRRYCRDFYDYIQNHPNNAGDY
ncbi:hypothetical protein O181_133399 [Austropuccinia psidii MF-1]|uniref:Uncharacterized protein n=1 Tax=Austropuccinia psidii MF-1 TaxID=1389203 RepID=A0A9Q3L6L4_9BASI|nr:hypothetical protein [Austropuccinia psidii MF-1]